MRILHLSDVHLSLENEKDFKQFYLDAFLKDVEKQHLDKKFDLIAITGDIFDKGGNSFSKDNEKYAYSYFKNIIADEIEGKLQSEIPIFYAIGNHDLILENVDQIIESGLNQELTNMSKINDFIDSHRIDNYQAFYKQNKFKEFEKSNIYTNCLTKYYSNFESAFVIEIDSKRIGIASFNSAWRCNPDLPAKLPCFGSRQVLEAADFFKKNNTFVNIGLIHHSPQLFDDNEKREVIKFLETKQFDILLCGHKHKAENTCLIGPQANTFFLTARNALNDPREKIADYIPGYSILDFFKEENRYDCQFRRYVHDRIEFDLDVEASPSGKTTGEISFSPDKKSFKEILDLTTNSFEAREDDLNSSLVTYGTNTNAPKKLKDIFVLPKLTNTLESYTSSSKITFNCIDEILGFSKRVIIFGRKESGKTILLNTIYTELACSIHRYQRIPVLINFNTLYSKDIIPLIRSFLNIGANKAKELLNKNRLIILIDDITEIESASGEIALKKLLKFYETYSKIKIVATTAIDFDSIITDENSFINKLSFKPIFINNVGTAEFKYLSEKWFAKKDQAWLNENLTKLIKTFEILRIPHTFFSITLFLWIIEKQENFKPQNQSMLVDTFLRYILEGLKSDESKAGTYNYDRKIELLSEIALDMYRSGDIHNNYGQKESKILSVVEKNFDLNQRKWQPSEKIAEFIKKGILCRCITDNTKIAFRFESFFKYLLSMNMDSMPSFLDEALQEQNIISFIDELDYYTSRNQKDRKVLDVVFKQLIQSFEDMNDRILDDVDQYLPKRSFLSKQTEKNEDLIKRIKKAKLSDEEIEAQLSEQFDSLPVSTSIQIKRKTDNKVYFHKVLELAARILKNSENIKDPETINKYLDTVIKLSNKYGIFLQSLIVNAYKEGQEQFIVLPKELIVLLAPLINQLMLLTWLGTDFIELPLKKHIEGLLKDQNASELEIYLATSLYSDMHFQQYISFIERSIAKIKNPYIAELFFMKIFLYYMMRPSNSSILPELEKLMKKLIIKTRGVSKSKASLIVSKVFKKKKLDTSENQ